MSNLPVLSTRYLRILWNIVFRAFRTLWITFHLYLPIAYRLELKQKPNFVSPGSRPGYYQAHARIGQEWSNRASWLRSHWTVYRDIFMMFVGVIAPYIAANKAPTPSMTFALGSLCVFYSLTGAIISHIYIANAENLHKPAVVDYWLEASGGNYDCGLWMWTILSLPAVWLVPSIFSFLVFMISAAWQPSQTISGYFPVGLLRVLLLSATAWAVIHSVMIVVTWLTVKKRPSLTL